MSDPIDLEPASGIEPVPDDRPLMPPTLPVRLAAVADVHLPAAMEMETPLDQFYCGILGLVRIWPIEPWRQVVFAAENHHLVFDLAPLPIGHESLIAVGIELDSLPAVTQRLIEDEIEFDWTRDLSTGPPFLRLRDPAGNWITIRQRDLLT